MEIQIKKKQTVVKNLKLGGKKRKIKQVCQSVKNKGNPTYCGEIKRTR